MEGLKKDVYIYIRSMKAVLQQENIRCKFVGASRGARYFSFGLRLADSLSLDKTMKLAKNIAYKSNVEDILTYRQKGIVIYQFQLAESYWKTYTREDVNGLGIGLAEQHQQVNLDFNEVPQACVIGSPGCGKTETVKSAIVALAQTYTPDECQFLILDYHNVLSDFHNLAHLAAPIAIQDRKQIDNVLLFAYSEYMKRMEKSLFDAPKLVVVFDEAADTASGDDQALDIIAKLSNGRKHGVHILLGTQKMDARRFPGIIHNIGHKICGRVNGGPRESANITSLPGLQAHKLTAHGDFLDIVGGNAKRFQVAMVTKKDIQNLPRKEVVAPDMTEYPTVTNLPKLPPVERSNGGRPTNSLEMPLLADYIYVYTDPENGPDAISIAGAKEMFSISRGMHDLHKVNALELIDELDKRGLFICREDGDK